MAPRSDGRIRVVWGTGTGPTALASYDAALAAAGVHNYNLVTLSSIIPPDASVASPGTAPDLGPPGDRLAVVEARGTTSGPGRATAALGWATGDGPGVFYEAGGEFDEATARREIERGLAAARDLREWSFSDQSIRTASVTTEDAFATAVVLAAYGEAEPLL